MYSYDDQNQALWDQRNISCTKNYEDYDPQYYGEASAGEAAVESTPVGKNGRRHEWRESKHDPRDYIFTISFKQLARAAKVSKLDLRKYCPKVYNQGQLGACTANAICACFEYLLMRQNLKDFPPSRLFVNYNSLSFGFGATFLATLLGMKKQGVCDEKLWPYDISKAADKPPLECYLTAKGNKILQFARVSSKVDHLKAALLATMSPIAFGFWVHQSFDTSEELAKTGYMPNPGNVKDDPITGGHAVALVGFDDKKKVFILRNSYGSDWGDNGYFYMSYEYVARKKPIAECWVVTLVNENYQTKPRPMPCPDVGPGPMVEGWPK